MIFTPQSCSWFSQTLKRISQLLEALELLKKFIQKIKKTNYHSILGSFSLPFELIFLAI